MERLRNLLKDTKLSNFKVHVFSLYHTPSTRRLGVNVGIAVSKDFYKVKF